MAINLWYDFVSENQFLNNLIDKETRLNYIKDITTISGTNFLKFNAELPNFLKKTKVNFNLLVSQTIPYLSNFNWNETQILPIELNFYKDTDTNILNFNDSFFLKNGKPNIEFLIWFPHEAPEVSMSQYFDAINNLYPKNKIRFVNGNLKTPNWVNDRSFINYKSFDYFWWNQQQYSRVNIDKDKEEIYTFSFFNHRNKIQRAIPFYSLLKQGILDNAAATFHGVVDHIENPRKEINNIIKFSSSREKIQSGLPPKEYLDFLSNDDFLNWMASKLTTDFKFKYEDFNSSSLHNETYLDFSVETFPIEKPDHHFITEKTYRPIANGCIFLTLSQPGTLKYLKSKGIETFSDLFDESYDETPHWFNRWKIIESNLKIWLELGKAGRKEYYKKNYDKLVHNQNIIFERNFKKEVEELFK